jgi:hypothetical protein
MTIMRAPEGYIWETVVPKAAYLETSTLALEGRANMLASPLLEAPEREFDSDDWDDAEEIDSDELDVELDEEEIEPEDDEDF